MAASSVRHVSRRVREILSENLCSDEEEVANVDEEMEENVKSKKRSDEMSEDSPSGNEEGDGEAGNAGWADAMLRVLRSGVPTAPSAKQRRVGRRKRSVILSRGKTDREVAETRKNKEEEAVAASSVPREDFEIERAPGADNEVVAGHDAEGSDELKSNQGQVVTKSHKKLLIELKERRIEKKVWEDLGHVKPDVTNRERERFLQRVATAGVVQLFNAVKQRQTTVETKLKEVGASETKREKVMKSMTKQDFLDVLKSAKSIRAPKTTKASKTTKTDDNLDVDDESKAHPSWQVLRDDYMMGAQMKDWDKASDTDENDDGDLGSAPTILPKKTKSNCSESDF